MTSEETLARQLAAANRRILAAELVRLGVDDEHADLVAARDAERVPFKPNGDVDSEALTTVAKEIRRTIGQRHGGTKDAPTADESPNAGGSGNWSKFRQELEQERAQEEQRSGPTASERLAGVRGGYDPVKAGKELAAAQRRGAEQNKDAFR